MKKVLRNKDEGNFLVRYAKSFIHAIDGILYAIRYEHNMIIILAAVIVVTCGGLYFDIKEAEWLFCIAISGIIMAAELINSSIEAVVDLETVKEHPLAKIAKDTVSGAVLVLCIVALIGAIIIFVPKFIC